MCLGRLRMAIQPARGHHSKKDWVRYCHQREHTIIGFLCSTCQFWDENDTTLSRSHSFGIYKKILSSEGEDHKKGHTTRKIWSVRTFLHLKGCNFLWLKPFFNPAIIGMATTKRSREEGDFFRRRCSQKTKKKTRTRDPHPACERQLHPRNILQGISSGWILFNHTQMLSELLFSWWTFSFFKIGSMKKSKIFAFAGLIDPTACWESENVWGIDQLRGRKPFTQSWPTLGLLVMN